MKLLASLVVVAVLAAQSAAERTIDSVTAVNYTDVDDFLLQGFVSNPDGAEGDVPAVVIIPDWDGVNTYEHQRAMLLAEIGYVGFAADIYGINDHEVDGGRRGELANLYRSNVTLFVQRIKAAVNLVKTLEGVDPTKVGVIGYCFGGTGVLGYGLTGQDDVQALVSFHGGLVLPDVGPEIVPELLVLSGGEDDTATRIMDLEDTLSEVNGTWEITRYSGIEHAFTVFSDNRYDLWADARSWQSMSTFLAKVFGVTNMFSMDMMTEDYVAPTGYTNEYVGEPPAMTNVVGVNYTDVDGTSLTGYLAKPEAMTGALLPAVVVIPDWDGVNHYEQQRATMLAESGYVAFAADIYGSDLQENLDFPTRIEQSTLYREDPALFVQRIQRGIDMIKATEGVDTENIAIIGYCFGGTGVIEYAFSGSSDVKAVASFHGGHRDLPEPMVNITPYVLVLSGGIDDAHGNQTLMEAAFNERNADWEISRYAMVDHGYTDWTSPAYNLRADVRSWESMMSVFASVMPVQGKSIVIGQPEFEAAATMAPVAPAPVTMVPATTAPVTSTAETMAPVPVVPASPKPTESPVPESGALSVDTAITSWLLLMASAAYFF